MISRLHILSLIIVIPNLTFAYDLKITCQAQGQLQDWRIQSVVTGLSRVTRAQVNDLCADTEYCLGQFRAIGRLAKQISAVTTEATQIESLRARAQHYENTAVGQLRSRVDQCLNNESSTVEGVFDGDRIALYYPHRGINSNQSGVYDRKKIEWILENALKHGVDPFAVLAIKLLEDASDLATPTANANTSTEDESDSYYSDEYGRIPVDSIAAYDVNGCLNPRGTFNYVSQRRHTAPYRELSARLDEAREKLIDAERSNDAENYEVAESEWEYLYEEMARLQTQKSVEELASDENVKSIREQLQIIEEYMIQMQSNSDVQNYIKAQEQVKIYEGQIETLKRNILGVRTTTRSASQPNLGVPTPPLPSSTNESHEISAFEEEALAMIEAELECTINRMCYTSIRTPERRVTYNLDIEGANTYTLCDRESLTIDRAHAPQFDLLSPSESARGCCVDVKSNQGPEGVAARIGEVKGLMGFEFIRQRVQSRARGSTLSHALQAFNGYGTFGSTEEMDNSCLKGINMNTSPVYGARAADLMVNTLMNNPAIREIIRKKQEETNRNPVSMMCLKQGPGEHKINGLTYLKEQKKYMNNPNCARYFRER